MTKCQEKRRKEILDALIQDAKASLARVEAKAVRLREAIATFMVEKKTATHN